MSNEQFIRDALLLPPMAWEYHVSQTLHQLFPERACVEVENGYFDPESFASADLCRITPQSFIHSQMMTYWLEPGPQMLHHGARGSIMPPQGIPLRRHSSRQRGKPSNPEQDILERAQNAWYEVLWQGVTLDVLCLNRSRFWILADTLETAQDFFAAVCRWNSELHGEVLVFNGGWYKDENLFQDIKGATFDNLILRGSLKQDIRDDLAQFFASRALYEEYGIPWKRGILFIGPPGNGKTHTVKALINSLQQPCLYIKSLQGIEMVFERARSVSPCLLVIEDLDLQLQPLMRSAFLNELDGFAANVGIVTLATTNHPERLDPGILDRPSRFDRKYHFELPDAPERASYLALWNSSLKPALQISSEAINRLGELTESFSFAYLKELLLSSMMQWIASPGQSTMEEVMTAKVASLREQMESLSSLDEEGASSGHMGPPMGRSMGRPR